MHKAKSTDLTHFLREEKKNHTAQAQQEKNIVVLYMLQNKCPRGVQASLSSVCFITPQVAGNVLNPLKLRSQEVMNPAPSAPLNSQ